MFRNYRGSDSERPASVYERVLGDRFADLDPQLRAYFGGIPDGFEGVGRGCFDEAGLRRRALRPMFAAAARRRIAFAERGADVPFTVRNVPAADGSLHAVRTFFFPHATREMRDVMRVADGNLVDRIGAHGEVEVELEASVSKGRLTMVSRRFALRLFGLRLPLPQLLRVVLCERTLSPEDRTQRVDVRVRVPWLGEVYGYSGAFTYELRARTTSGMSAPMRRGSDAQAFSSPEST